MFWTISFIPFQPTLSFLFLQRKLSTAKIQSGSGAGTGGSSSSSRRHSSNSGHWLAGKPCGDDCGSLLLFRQKCFSNKSLYSQLLLSSLFPNFILFSHVKPGTMSLVSRRFLFTCRKLPFFIPPNPKSKSENCVSIKTLNKTVVFSRSTGQYATI